MSSRYRIWISFIQDKRKSVYHPVFLTLSSSRQSINKWPETRYFIKRIFASRIKLPPPPPPFSNRSMAAVTCFSSVFSRSTYPLIDLFYLTNALIGLSPLYLSKDSLQNTFLLHNRNYVFYLPIPKNKHFLYMESIKYTK